MCIPNGCHIFPFTGNNHNGNLISFFSFLLFCFDLFLVFFLFFLFHYFFFFLFFCLYVFFYFFFVSFLLTFFFFHYLGPTVYNNSIRQINGITNSCLLHSRFKNRILSFLMILR